MKPCCISNRVMVGLVNWRNGEAGWQGNHRFAKSALIELPLLVLAVTAAAEGMLGAIAAIPVLLSKSTGTVTNFIITWPLNAFGTTFIALKNALYNNIFCEEADTSSILGIGPGKLSPEKCMIKLTHVKDTQNHFYLISSRRPELRIKPTHSIEIDGTLHWVPSMGDKGIDSKGVEHTLAQPPATVVIPIRKVEEPGFFFCKRDSYGMLTPGFLCPAYDE